MRFGVLYLAECVRQQPVDRRIAFARRWIGQILGSLLDRPGPIMLARVGCGSSVTLGSPMRRRWALAG
jgi:hypothetical protein